MRPLQICHCLLVLALVLLVAWVPQERNGQLFEFSSAIPDWKVGSPKPVSLLVAFDVDPGLDRLGYAKFYDHDVAEFFPQSQCRYQTLMWTRSSDSVRLTSGLPIVACPTKRGFLYAGFAGYSKAPTPGKSEKWCGQDCPPSFADCGDIWQTYDPAQIPQSIANLERKLATGPCGMTDKDKSNITDQWRVSFITPKVLALRHFEAQITGGATRFTASEEDHESGLEKGSDLRLTDVIPSETINRSFRSAFRKRQWTVSWGKGDEDVTHFNFAEDAGFTFENRGNTIHLIGLHHAAGNAEREFLADVDLGVASSSLVANADSALDFGLFKKIDPKAVAVFTSPDKATIFVLTTERMVAIDAKSKRELFSAKHGLKFNKIIMTEWAEGEHTARWQEQLEFVSSRLPKSLSCSR